MEIQSFDDVVVHTHLGGLYRIIRPPTKKEPVTTVVCKMGTKNYLTAYATNLKPLILENGNKAKFKRKDEV